MSDYKRLDPSGLTYFSGKLKNLIDPKLQITSISSADYDLLPVSDKKKEMLFMR